jgi:hypothetical protein
VASYLRGLTNERFRYRRHRTSWRDCPESDSSNAPSVNLAGIRGTKWTEKPSLAARRARLQASPRFFGQSRRRVSRKDKFIADSPPPVTLVGDIEKKIGKGVTSWLSSLCDPHSHHSRMRRRRFSCRRRSGTSWSDAGFRGGTNRRGATGRNRGVRAPYARGALFEQERLRGGARAARALAPPLASTKLTDTNKKATTMMESPGRSKVTNGQVKRHE